MRRRTFLRKSTRVLIGLGAFGSVTMSCRSRHVFDLVLAAGEVLDGTGKPAVSADVGIKNGRIVAVGDLSRKQAARVIDVAGLTVAPGFIDVHAHSEDELLANPKAESKIRQGVTTEVLGQDGGSVAPLTQEMREKMDADYQKRFGITVAWRELEGYFATLRKRGASVNVASMVGQGTLREYVIGESDREATASDISKMQELAAAALRQGALGISSGLEYTPGAFASTSEIARLCSVMKSSGGLYATHMRNEDDRVLEAVSEAISIAQEAGVGLHISHLKSMGERNWNKLDEIFSLIQGTIVAGLSVTLDRYPYVAYSTGLASLMPIWAREGGREKFLSRLADESLLARIKSETLEKVRMTGSWQSVMISSVSLEKNRVFQGQTVEQISTEKRLDPFEFVCSLLIEEKGRIGMCGFAMSEENISRIFQHPHCIVASDGSALAPYGPLGESQPHPRSYGTFPRFLGKYVREEGVLALPEAVRKITGLPAARFKLSERGQIQEGFFADLVVFDPETITDKATFSDPHQYPEGIRYVVVNGEVVVENGEHTGQLPGVILTRSV